MPHTARPNSPRRPATDRRFAGVQNDDRGGPRRSARIGVLLAAYRLFAPVRVAADCSDGLDTDALARRLDDLADVSLVRREDDVIVPSSGPLNDSDINYVAVIGSAS